MAKGTIRVTGTEIEWLDSAGNVEFTFDTETLGTAARVQMMLYGAKQCLSDAGAVEKGTPDNERIARMHKRAQALRDDTYRFRDGHAAPKPAAERDAQFDALVACGIIGEGYRAAWNALRPSERAAVMRDNPEAAARVARASAVDGASVLQRILAK